MVTIQDLAMKHLFRHRNDKSGRIVAKMNRRFGAAATKEAILEARKVLFMVEPGHPEAYRPETQGLSKIQGKKVSYIILDEFR